MARVVGVQLDVMNLEVVLIQQSSLLEARLTDTTEIGLVGVVFGSQSDLLDEKFWSVGGVLQEVRVLLSDVILHGCHLPLPAMNK